MTYIPADQEKMREKVRERRSLGASSYGGNRDFRESLFSVFVDNINPVVDSAGLWGMFKPFGKVRDIFLSAKKESRGSCYAFIRFGSLEEAQGVAKKVNGMYIYGWPIIAKVADFGWNNRRSSVREKTEAMRPNWNFREAMLNRGMYKSKNSRTVRQMQNQRQEKRTFVDIVK